MLNRYGLFDIEKLLREQGEPPAPAPQAAPPPAPPEEDPDDKRRDSLNKARDEDLDEFRKDHSDAIYRVVQTYLAYKKSGRKQQDPRIVDQSANERYAFSTELQGLKDKFDGAGIDAPVIAAFDSDTTGLHGNGHIAMLAGIAGAKFTAHGEDEGRLEFNTPGEAREFGETVDAMRDDIEFAADKNEPTVLNFSPAPEEKPEELQQQQQAPPPPQPQQPQSPPPQVGGGQVGQQQPF
jgi:hypothetical protein